MQEQIHLHPTKTSFSYHVFLLLLPAVVFVLVLTFIIAKTKTDKQIATSVDNQPVLGQEANQASSNKTQVTIGNKTILVDIASTPAQQEKGLGGVKSLTDDQGMLFPFPEPNDTSVFWMKGMVMPIDIIWIKANRVIWINKNALPEPGVEDSRLIKYYPVGANDIDYVLETAAGFSDRYNINIGTSVDLGKLF